MEKIKVAFVCVGNSCRSQIAEGFLRELGSENFEAYSAGSHPASAIAPLAIAVMAEKGIDISSQYSKHYKELPPLDIVITMGCEVQCPIIPSKFREDWGLADPVGKPIEFFREIRDKIEEKVKELINKFKK